ncbi:MAG TPA: UDP-N-acetylglucosamine 2-epimerase (non-hydrolyzing) [Deltaproteobacteria bacterium]|nr:UDP-N-acetylglucosamine 2-epimerase (non-hydrolyzing) [Deltaproteobacteria bacterium]
MTRRPLRIATVFGTRPEAVKLAPVIWELRRSEGFETMVTVTSQHREMLDQPLEIFDIEPDHDLNIMRPGQDLFDISVRALEGLGRLFKENRPDCVLVQGDTTTTFIGALAAFYLKIPVGHVEAGLRTGNRYSPFPEEMNRKITTSIATLHFAPTERARENLLAENVAPEDVYVTGNTAIDALLWLIDKRECNLEEALGPEVSARTEGRFILVTTHRRESFGRPMRNTMEAVAEIASMFPDVSVIFPVHLNPNVRREAFALLKDVENVFLLEPLDYHTFVHLMNRCSVILTDSGGIQEEAPSLGKPVLVLRENTERPEGVEAGTARLVGTDKALIVDEVARLLGDEDYYASMAGARNPYGDGRAAGRIVSILAERLSARQTVGSRLR